MPDDILDNAIPATGSAVASNAGLDRAHDQASRVGMPERLEDKVQALRYRHPDYVENVGKWDKYLQFYEAMDIYKYLHKHGRETETCFSDRVSRGYFLNYVQSVVDLFVAYLYHAPITRPVPKDGVLVDIYRDADLRGTKYDLFIHDCATYSQVAGHVGVLVDMPKGNPEGYPSKYHAQVGGQRPYLTSVQANQILDWELDEQEKFEWVKLLVPRSQHRTWDTTVDADSEYFLIWRKDGWEEWKVFTDYQSQEDGTSRRAPTAVQIGEGENPIGEVPLVIMRNGKRLSHPWFGLSAVRDIVDINKAILNWSSLGDEEIFERCLNVLAMEGDDDAVPRQLSHHNVLMYQGAEHPPFYLTPGATPLELISAWINNAKDEIYRIAKMGGATGMREVREATSGIAYAYEFNETNQSLASKAENLEHGEREIHRLIAKWSGEKIGNDEDPGAGISYPREFGVDDFLMELQIITEGRTAFSSKTARKELEKRVARKFFARDAQMTRNKIEREIEENDGKGPDVLDMNTVLPQMIRGPAAGTSAKTESRKVAQDSPAPATE